MGTGEISAKHTIKCTAIDCGTLNTMDGATLTPQLGYITCGDTSTMIDAPSGRPFVDAPSGRRKQKRLLLNPIPFKALCSGRHVLAGSRGPSY